ncbi:TRAP transporter substrate-binding protein DctP [Fulvimarina sp. 2208YS6-2-32]|uniref:TRAP transporter substrate-binding protein DctP n=1 Tax=Fulvimarina uroteuthidis TaxID=3098149 RepID=A0ABU5I0B2_9HYPH|nr:TRAP transporter substrate-binding protein DctP [Fulvimarina sp. 2208YS6-2-32]MDY8108829.1 TRAP transporter substrate-binding protein DctP [Fulvimarina sp. 2208YS6-2-32]
MSTLIRTTKRAFLATCMATTATLALSAGSASAEEWKYAIEEALDEVQGVYAQKFKEYVEANSDHTVSIFPFGTLGESADTTELAQMGAIQFVDLSPGFTGSLIPELQVFLLPYTLPEDPAVLADFYKTSETINEDLAALYEEQSLHLIDMFPEGEVVMTTKEAVKSPADLDGVKFRVMTTPLLVETYDAFGATPTPLPWGEVFGALQLNMIQGQENPMFFVESTKMYEVTDHITFTGHNTFTTAVAANKSFYDGLSEEDKEMVNAAADKAYDYIIEYQKGLQDKALAAIKEAKPSITVTTLTDEERQPFREAAKAVRESYAEMTGESGQKVLDGFEADIAASVERVNGGSDSADASPAEAPAATPASDAASAEGGESAAN